MVLKSGAKVQLLPIKKRGQVRMFYFSEINMNSLFYIKL